ncbi:MAG: HEAT repeat domain-containing protein [Kaiparowitsia implicata GSE-PSE-MK54-09C]|jgi:HEAT repeat protein|nr:HEAT repeat domain-containing protein [Kaiparowitsia implicata GSE-PSE-MK54-09C]
MSDFNSDLNSNLLDSDLGQRQQLERLLQRAETSAHIEDWFSVVQHLHQGMLMLDAVLEQESRTEATPSSAVAEAWERSLDLALRVLDDGEFQDRWDIGNLLVTLSKLAPHRADAVIQPLMQRLQQSQDASPDDPQDDTDVQWFAARILGKFQQPAVLDTLVQVICDSPRDELTDVAAQALSGFGESAVAALAALLRQPKTRRLATKTLTQVQHPAAIEPLLSVVDDDDSQVRAMALSALSRFRDPRVIPLLLQALQDPASQVRQTAVADLSAWVGVCTTIDWIGVMQPLLWDSASTVRQQAVMTLGRVGTATAVNELYWAFMQPPQDGVMRVCIVRALGWINTAAALEVLVALTDPGIEMAQEVLLELIAALGRVREPRLTLLAFRGLQQVLTAQDNQGRSPLIKQAVAQELGQLGEPAALDVLVDLAADPNMIVKLHAVAALKKLDALVAHQRLLDLAEDASQSGLVRQQAAIALQEWC